MLHISRLDNLISAYLNIQNPIINSLASILSFSLIFIIIAVLISLIYQKKVSRAKTLSSYLIITYIFILFLKAIFLRPRPDLSNLQSFPSAHAAVAFALACNSKNKPLFYSYAVLIALSRMILQAHYFTDVLAGAVIGIIIIKILKNKN